MEVQKRKPNMVSPTVLLLLTCAIFFISLPQVSATRFIVGAKYGWTTNVNYTDWAGNQTFYLDDWLFFVYDRNQQNVLEVNKTDYELCNSDHPLHNWTTGAGRDVVPLNVTRHYYFISGKGFCFGGMKLAVRVQNLPPPPKASPINHKNASPSSSRTRIVIGVVVAVIWTSFFTLW
ncbi:hypothetical protein GIB67_039336 [Kingdonia uniflora]|uniref:Phytocyanin domain-containing protein n=1 Tax=Kingdonia uniflora TaxID=39325 RepID=A0A7J7LX25_9MAGN|nr:hypothetical protein GIB67_039336 [Kingdonia uniflora]